MKIIKTPSERVARQLADETQERANNELARMVIEFMVGKHCRVWDYHEAFVVDFLNEYFARLEKQNEIVERRKKLGLKIR
jgi:hypothetical protein